MMEFWIERSERQKKKKKALGLLLFPTEEQASNFSEICLEESHMIRPWRKMVQESWLVFKDHLLQAEKRSVLTRRKSSKRRKETCVDEQEPSN